MAFPDSVTGWLLGGSNSWHFADATPDGYHRIAFDFISDNGTTLTYRIYHQICLTTTSFVMTGYSAKYTYTINGSSISMDMKNGNHSWNTGENGTANYYYTATTHYTYNGKNLHSYDINTSFSGSKPNNGTTWGSVDLTFNKSTDGIVYFSMSYGNGPGNQANGVAGSMKVTVSSVKISTGRPAYTAPTYSYNSIEPIYGILNETDFKPNYTISGGTGDIDWTRVRIYNSSDAYLGYYDLNNKSKGTKTGSFKLGTSYSDGTQYKTAIRFSDNTQELETGKRTIYTYRTPKVSSVSLSPSSFSGTGNTTLKWTTNGRRWGTANESNFVTTFRFNTNETIINSSDNTPNDGDTTNTSVEKSQNLSTDIINSSFTTAQRCQEKITTTVTVIRTNPSSKKTASSSSGNVTIQFWPKYEISSISYTDPGNNNTSISAGSTNYIDNLPKITVNWSYPASADRGIIDGFIIRIYEKDGTTQVGEDYKVSATTISKEFNTKTQLRRGELNYIKIIPYYIMPDKDKTIKEGPATIKQFILPIGRIVKPKIMFPTNSSEWHNKNFRILLTCPEDGDFDIYGITKDEYRYKNIEVNITGPDNFNKTYTYSSNSTIFSTSSMSYEKDIAINPSVLSSFPDLSYYYMKIRFQKNYYQNIWSEWSDTVLIYNTSISEINISKENKIMLSHYSTVRDYSIRLWEVYHDKEKESYDSNNVKKAKEDIIYAINYQGIYNTILAIYNKVNEWCTYDSNRSNVNFTQAITNMSGTLVPKKDELISASKVSNEPAGRNYKNILIECMNKLY